MDPLQPMTKDEEKRKRRAAQNRARTEKEISRLTRKIPAFLKENGPTEFATLLDALETTIGRLSKVGRMLEESGVIHRYRAYPGRDSRRMWSLDHSPEIEPKPRNEAKRPEIGMEPEDLAWMEQQQKNAAERQARRERMARR